MRGIYTVGVVMGLGTVFGCGEHGDGHRSMVLPTTRAIPAIDRAAVFVVNGGDASLSVIDAVTFEPLGTIVIENASFPHHIRVNPDRSKLVLSIPGIDLSGGHNMGGNAGHAAMAESFLLVLDAQTGATLAVRKLEAPAHNGIYSPDGTEIWAAQMTTAGEVWVLNANTLETEQRLAVGSMPAEVTFSADGGRAFVANSASDTVTVFDSASKETLATIAVGDGPVGAWAGSDNVMYVDNEQGQSITAIAASTLEVVRTYTLGFTPAMAATAPADVLLITDTGAGRLVFNSTLGDMEAAIISTAAGAHAIAVLPDGSTALVTNQMAGTVSVVDLAQREIIQTATVGQKPNGLVYVAR